MSANQAECAFSKDAVPAYLEHVLSGRDILDRADIEEHVAECGACAIAYADLVGIKVMDEVEQILDVTLGMNPISDGDRIRGALGAFSLHLDLALSSSLHWLDVSRNGLVPDEHSSASALTCIGAILELKGNFNEALGHYEEAAALARQVDNGYARVRSASGRGRVLAALGRKGEAIACLRAACSEGLELRDSFELARDYLAIGDALRDSRGIPGRMEVLRSYGRASRIAVEVGYQQGRAAAEARLSDCRESGAIFFRDLIGSFVKDHVKKEAAFLDEFCRAFLDGLVNVFGRGVVLAPQAASSRLGFSATTGDIKTIALLSTIVTAFDDIAAGRFAGGGDETAGSAPAGTALAGRPGEIRQDIALATRRAAGQHGLGRSESGRLAEYLVQHIAGDPELLGDIEFATIDS